jgi:hypothetical protein
MLDRGGMARPDADDSVVREDGTEPRGCGNGILESPPEECDDGNPFSGDGCEADCTFTCSWPLECEDHNQCTDDVCEDRENGRICVNTPVADRPCDDGNPCTTGERCIVGGDCSGGTNECYCLTTADCVPREDGNDCNGTLVCLANACQVDPATVIICPTDDDPPCQRTECNPATGDCELRPSGDGDPCEDGQWCTSGDTCSGGSCRGGSSRCGRGCEVCNESAHRCDAAAGWCIIEGACRRPGETPFYSLCLTCSPDHDRYDWTALSAGTSCDDGRFCNGVDTCDGWGNCEVGERPCSIGDCSEACNEATDRCEAAAGAICRPAEGRCDEDEVCDGTSTACPADRRKPAGTVCREATEPCDVAETCSGTSVRCPADGFAPRGTECRPAAGLCDRPEACTGDDPECPIDYLQAAGFTCREADGACDVAEVCDGSSPECPTNGFRPAETSCGTLSGECDAPEACTGDSADCPPDRPAGTDVVCRPAAGDCDAAENCPGSTKSCPPDEGLADGTSCGAGGLCCGGTCLTGAQCCSFDQCPPATSDACDSDNRCVCGSAPACTGGPKCCAGACHACCTNADCTGTDVCCSATSAHPFTCRADNPSCTTP